MVKKNWLYLSLIVLFFGCQKEDPYLAIISEGSWMLGSSRLILELDDETGRPGWIRGLTSHNEFYFYNYLNESIYVYGLEDSINIIKYKINVPFDEAIAFEQVDELYFHNTDSIFLYTDRNYHNDKSDIFLINHDGEIVNHFKIFNSSMGSPKKISKSSSANSPTLFFIDGKLIFSVSPTTHTDPDKFSPLLIYDLITHSTSYHGSFPYTISKDNSYGSFSFISYMALDCTNKEIHVTFPVINNIFTYNLESEVWNTLNFKSTFISVAKPISANENRMAYLSKNDWFTNTLYNGISKRLLRGGMAPASAELDLQNPGINDFLFEIDILSGDYHYYRDLRLNQIWFIHPTLGPMIQVYAEPDELPGDPEDYWVLAPLELQTEKTIERE